MIKFAIHGLAGSGKTTLAKIIEEVYIERGFTVSNTPLAKPIKDIIKDLFNIDESVIEDRERKEEVIETLGKSVRELMTYIGTDVFKKLKKDIWINKCLSAIYGANNDVSIIPDVRFEDEYEILKKEGFVMIKIKREDIDNKINHISEQGLPDELFDHVIDNNTSLESLKQYVLNHIVDERNFILTDLYHYLGKDIRYIDEYGKLKTLRLNATNILEVHNNFEQGVWQVAMKTLSDFLLNSSKYPDIYDEFSQIELHGLSNKYSMTGSAVKCHQWISLKQAENFINNGFDLYDLRYKY